MAGFEERMLERRRAKMRQANDQRETERRDTRLLQADIHPMGPVQREETFEQRQQRRSQKIAGMCQQLRGMTPDNADAQNAAEQACNQALALFATDFENARSFMTEAIEARREANRKEKVKMT